MARTCLLKYSWLEILFRPFCVASGFAVVVVDVDKVDVAGDIEFACTQFAHAHNAQLRPLAQRPQGRAMQRIERAAAVFKGHIQGQFGQRGHGQGHAVEVELGIAILRHQAFQHQLAQDAQCGPRGQAFSCQCVQHRLHSHAVRNTGGQLIEVVPIAPAHSLGKTRPGRAQLDRFRVRWPGHNSLHIEHCTMTDVTSKPSRPLQLLATSVRWILWLLASAWITVALVWSGLHFWIVPRIGEFRPWIEQQASATLGVTVRIGGITAQSNGLIPSVALRDVRLLDQAGNQALALPSVIAALSPRSLLALGFEQLYIRAPRLGCAQDCRRAPVGCRVLGAARAAW